ncbi:MAG: hypothetical protein HYY10_00765 [Candidatus Liptonbacteria bacterium]|nr:hypothetical protein [Candidatus Liptonbacteria bacterium]
MKKIFMLAGGMLVAVVAFVHLSTARAAEIPNCALNVKSGWNLKSIGEFVCGFMEIDSSNTKISNFPAYIDVYGYDGREYVHGRIRKQDIENRNNGSFGNSVESYFNSRIKNITGGQYSTVESYFSDAENSITGNNLQKIKEYAGKLARESFSSVWIYNPGSDFSVVHYPRTNDDDDEIMAILGLNLLSGNISDSGYAQLKASLEEWSVSASRELERYPGMISFIRELFSGRVPLESGWNFLSYSKVLLDDGGRINLNSGNCNITKAYLFNNSTKNWVRLGDVSASMVGSGLVAYNAGSACTLNVKNQYLDFVTNLLGGGSQATPPPLPN